MNYLVVRRFFTDGQWIEVGTIVSFQRAAQWTKLRSLVNARILQPVPVDYRPSGDTPYLEPLSAEDIAARNAARAAQELGLIPEAPAPVEEEATVFVSPELAEDANLLEAIMAATTDEELQIAQQRARRAAARRDKRERERLAVPV